MGWRGNARRSPLQEDVRAAKVVGSLYTIDRLNLCRSAGTSAMFSWGLLPLFVEQLCSC